MKYYVFWERTDGADEGMCDDALDSRAEAEEVIRLMKEDDVKDGEADMWVYRIEERDEDDEDGEGEGEGKGEGKELGLECGDHPDERSVVCADGRVRRFGSAYQREMWEIGMRESDFC